MKGIKSHRRWRMIAAVLALTLAWGAVLGCNGDNDDDLPGDEQRGAFDLTVSGDISEQLSLNTEGQTQYHLNEDEGYCNLTMADERFDRIYSVQLYYVGDECPAPGFYVVVPQSDAEDGQFWGLFTVLGADEQPVFGSTSGTVEVTARPNNRIEGELDATFVHLLEEERSVDIEGAFEVVVLPGFGD